MRTPRIFFGALPLLLLCGCLEVKQHPPWIGGEYNGKRDNLPAQVHYHGDQLAWSAAMADRNRKQDEYNRMN